MMTTTANLLSTAYFHAGTSHYTLRYQTIMGARKAVSMLEERANPNGTMTSHAYLTPRAVTTRLAAAKRYNLHACGEGGCSHATMPTTTQAHGAPRVPQAFYTGSPRRNAANFQNPPVSDDEIDTAINDAAARINARTPLPELCGLPMCGTDQGYHDRSDSCISATDNHTQEHDLTDDSDVCSVADCIQMRGGDHLYDSDTCLPF